MFSTKIILLSALVSLFYSKGFAQNRNNKADTARVETTKKSDTAFGKLKPYKEVISEKAVSDSGFFTIHKVNESYFFEIPISLFDKDILTVNRISKAAAGAYNPRFMIGFAGDLIGENVIQFSKGPSNKLFIKTVSFLTRSGDSTENGLYRSVLNSNFLPIVASFDIKTVSADSGSVVIDVTEYLNSDNSIFFFENSNKTLLQLGALQPDKSYINTIKAFPSNVEIRTTKTYGNTAGNVTYELNSSLVLLPEKPMQPRYFDNRVGYFSVNYLNYDANPQRVERTAMITRWRLEPEDESKYLAGVLVEPKNPIIFYIDPNTPKKWVPYLIQGVNDWQKAFEKAGFKNAIYALEAPTNNPEWNIEDARHNAIVYKASEIPNASGPHIHDPRSGEILETHVNWYHNVMQLLHDWYLVQAAAIDSNARKMQFNDSLMGQLIRFVCSHEVGHTLGLLHNFGSSSTVPVDSLRNKKWVEKHGHTPSIMDYARFNYVAQPEDSITVEGIFPRIGAYDEWAIEWGYRWFPKFKNPKDEKVFLNSWIINNPNSYKQLWFGGQNFTSDPRCQAEDLGDDAIKASFYGIKNLKLILSNLLEWTTDSGDTYDNLERLYIAVTDQYKRYLFHVARNIGGIMITPKTSDQKGAVIDFTKKEQQRKSLRFLHQNLFNTPYWILDKKIFSLTSKGTVYDILSLQQSVLNKLMSHETFSNLLFFETTNPQGAYTTSQLLDDLKSGIWNELTTRKPVDIYRRNLQKLYVSQLIGRLTPEEQKENSDFTHGMANLNTDIISIIKVHIKKLIKDINNALPGFKDEISQIHLIDLNERLKKSIESKK